MASDFRNVRAVVLANKALRKLGKGQVELSPAAVNYLFTIWLLGGKDVYLPVKAIELGLKRARRCPSSYKCVLNALLLYHNCGLLLKEQRARGVWFKLSIQAINLLREYEKRLSAERFDR